MSDHGATMLAMRDEFQASSLIRKAPGDLPEHAKRMFDEQRAPAHLKVASLAPGGWMMVDNRNAGGELSEYDTYTCCHCNRVVLMNPGRIRPRHSCSKCQATVCDEAVCNLECDPVEKKIEAGRSLLLPHQITPAIAARLYTPDVVAKTPERWIPDVMKRSPA